MKRLAISGWMCISFTPIVTWASEANRYLLSFNVTIYWNGERDSYPQLHETFLDISDFLLAEDILEHLAAAIRHPSSVQVNMLPSSQAIHNSYT
jgi:hypothetical protein